MNDITMITTFVTMGHVKTSIILKTDAQINVYAYDRSKFYRKKETPYVCCISIELYLDQKFLTVKAQIWGK